MGVEGIGELETEGDELQTGSTEDEGKSILELGIEVKEGEEELEPGIALRSTKVLTSVGTKEVDRLQESIVETD